MNETQRKTMFGRDFINVPEGSGTKLARTPCPLHYHRDLSDNAILRINQRKRP